jgi:hypothetical protein
VFQVLDSIKEVLARREDLVRQSCVGDLAEQQFEGAKCSRRLGESFWLRSDGTVAVGRSTAESSGLPT